MLYPRKLVEPLVQPASVGFSHPVLLEDLEAGGSEIPAVDYSVYAVPEEPEPAAELKPGLAPVVSAPEQAVPPGIPAPAPVALGSGTPAVPLAEAASWPAPPGTVIKKGQGGGGLGGIPAPAYPPGGNGSHPRGGGGQCPRRGGAGNGGTGKSGPSVNLAAPEPQFDEADPSPAQMAF